MAPNPWTCPECGRRFTRARRSHSCVSVTEAALLEGKPPEVRSAFHKLRDAVAGFGEVHVDARAWPRAGRLDVEPVLDHPLKAKRKHVHWVPVTGPAEVDAELPSWLREPFALRRQ